jgi:hypothetical protein
MCCVSSLTHATGYSVQPVGAALATGSEPSSLRVPLAVPEPKRLADDCPKRCTRVSACSSSRGLNTADGVVQSLKILKAKKRLGQLSAAAAGEPLSRQPERGAAGYCQYGGLATVTAAVQCGAECH